MRAGGPREVRRPPRVAKEVAGPRGEGGGKVEERVMVLVFLVFGGDGELILMEKEKENVTKMMMMVML